HREALADGVGSRNRPGGVSTLERRQMNLTGDKPTLSCRFRERQSIRKTALQIVKLSQIVEPDSHVGMIRLEGFVEDLESPFEEQFGIGVAALLLVQLAHIA